MGVISRQRFETDNAPRLGEHLIDEIRTSSGNNVRHHNDGRAATELRPMLRRNLNGIAIDGGVKLNGMHEGNPKLI